MTASEMFEELGYKRNVEDNKITYSQKFGYEIFEIMFDLSKKEINIDTDMEVNIEEDILQAIDKQAEELGWIDEKTCTNLSEFDSIDEFECSNCGIVFAEYQEIKVDEDDGERYFYDYRPKYCPNCGSKIIDRQGD
jgi:predicted RNA-binding Zn-ribbon protein involved in translation (DUF1610 family)